MTKKTPNHLFINLTRLFPGICDNITPNGKGGYFVGIPGVAGGEDLEGFQFLMRSPLLCKFITRIVYNLKRLLVFVACSLMHTLLTVSFGNNLSSSLDLWMVAGFTAALDDVTVLFPVPGVLYCRD